MKSLETLYFPDTAIVSPRQAPLLLLFTRINIIQLIEDDVSAASTPGTTFMDSQFCQTLPIHPLGKDRERFLYLINDIKNRKDDYASQLSHVTLASMSEPLAKDDSAKHQIVSSLLGDKTGANDNKEKTQNDTLWHSRLILAIAEILDREEEEVAQALRFLEDSEAGMFDQLKGQDDEESDGLYRDVSKITAKLSLPKSQTVDSRLRAWFKFTYNADLPQLPIWSTSRVESAEILFEHHENEHGSQPLHICDVELPVHIGKDITEITSIFDTFQHESSTVIQSFWQQLLSAQTNITEKEEFMAFQSTWQELLKASYPADTFGRTQARFYLFQNPVAGYSDLNTPDSVQQARILALLASSN